MNEEVKYPAAEFKAKCLALIDRVRERGEPITITKRGRVVARLFRSATKRSGRGRHCAGADDGSVIRLLQSSMKTRSRSSSRRASGLGARDNTRPRYTRLGRMDDRQHRFTGVHPRRARTTRAGHATHLSAISLWEVAMLVELERLSLSMPLVEWLSLAAHPRTVKLIPITPAIAAGTAALPSTFHRDPADRIIVATCLELDAPLLTHDKLIMRSRLVSRWPR